MNKELLQNFHRILVLVRLDIRCTTNVSIFQLLLERLRGERENELMYKEIISVDGKYGAVLLQEECAFQEKIQNTERFCPMFERMLEEVIDAIGKQEYEYAYDMVDVFEVLPNIILEESTKSLKQYWKIYIKPFEKKWKKNIFSEFEGIFKERTFKSCFCKK